MILDGKYIEPNSIPLNRLDTSVTTVTQSTEAHEAINTEINKIKGLTNDSTVPLQAFYNKTVNHFATKINDTSTATDPAHTIKDGTVTNAMLASGLKDVIVYTNVANNSSNPISTYKEFTAAAKVSSSSSSTTALTVAGASSSAPALTVSAGNTALINTTVSGTLNVTNSKKTTLSGALEVQGDSTVQNLTVNGNLTVAGNNTYVNQSVLNITDRQIIIAKGATDTTIASSTGTTDQPGIVIDLGGYSGSTNATNQKKTPKLIYCDDLKVSPNTGWCVVNYNDSGLIRPLATKAYVDAQISAAGSSSGGLVGAVKKAFAVGVASITASTNAGKKVEVTLPSDFDSRTTPARYIVLVQLNQQASTVVSGTSDTMAAPTTSAGEIWINKQNGKFSINLTGAVTSGTLSFGWVAISLNYSNVVSAPGTAHTLLSGV